MSMPVKRRPTVWLVLPSKPSSRSPVLLDVEPEILCSTSSPAAAILFSNVVGVLPVTLTLKA
jgi:hypothetical protein